MDDDEIRELREVLFGHLFAEFCSVVPAEAWRKKTFLEFGGSYPSYAQQYRRYFGEGTVVDVVDWSADYAGEERLQFLLSDGNTIAVPDRSVDYVFSHSALEHVQDLRRSLAEIDRILALRGVAYLTVSPLYYASSGGHHGKAGWEHLDPASEHYVDDKDYAEMPAALNRLTSAKLLAEVGRLPWEILRYRTVFSEYGRQRPDFIRPEVSDLDVHTREFRLIVRKQCFFRDGEAWNSEKASLKPAKLAKAPGVGAADGSLGPVL